MFSHGRGATLMEVLLFMLVASALLLVAITAYRPSGVQARYQAERLRADLRHAQMLALAWGQRVRITTTGSNYSLACVGAASGTCAAAVSVPCISAAVLDPATGSRFCVPLETGVVLSPATTLDFDALGRPLSSGGAILTASTAFTISGGGTTYTVTVLPITGFAQLP